MFQRVRNFLLASLVVVVAPQLYAQEADLGITKTGPVSAEADTDVTYTIAVTNFGPDPSTNVTITDSTPAGMTFVSFSESAPFTCSESGGTVTCAAPALSAGATAGFDVTFHIDGDTPPGTFFTNIATVSAETFDPNEENNQANFVTQTPPPAQTDLGVTKLADPAAGADTDVTYSITLYNGNAAGTNVEITDTLPGDMTFVSLTQVSGPALNCTVPAIGAGGTVTCSTASFAANATAQFTLVTHVPAGTPSGTTYSNSVIVAADNDAQEDNNIATVSVTISDVDLSTTKSGPATADAGSNISYTLTITNAGPDTATNAVLTDALPAGTTFVSLTRNSGPAATCSTPAVGSNGTISCGFEFFAAGATTQFTLVVAVGNTLSVTNTVVASTQDYDRAPTNDSASVTTTVNPVADLSVVKSGPASVTAGENISYTITASNGGPSDATNVSISDALPAGTTFVAITQATGPLFSCATPAVGANGSVTCTIATFPANASAQFNLIVRVDPNATTGSTISNTANITSTTTDPDPNDNISTATSTTVTTSADVSVVKSGDNAVVAGSNVTYLVTVTNAGPSDAAQVSLSDVVPAGTTFVSAMQTSGSPFSCATPAAGATGTILCSAATLPAGATATFTFVFSTDTSTPSPITNTATITALTPDPAAANNESTAATTVSTLAADLAVTKSGDASVLAGSNVTYQVTVTNAGPDAAASVVLTDTVPTGTTFVSATQVSGPSFSCAVPAAGGTGTITCSAASLASGATASFTFVFSSSATTPSPITNRASVTSSTGDPATANNESTAVTTVTPLAADLAITKSGDASVISGGSVTYDVVVTNAGPDAAAGVSITDALPAGTTFVSATQISGPPFSCTTPAVGSSGVIVCSGATLAAGASVAFEFVVATDLFATGTISNTATVTSITSDPAPANNSSRAETTITPSPEIPTASPLMLMLMALTLAVVGSVALRR